MIKTKYILSCLVLATALTLVLGSKANALSGEVSSIYPNSSIGPEITYATSELCSNDTTQCMKGAITYAYIFVPTTLLGQQTTLTIVDGCDSTAVDNGIITGNSFGYTANTLFEVVSPTNFFANTGSVTTPANAGNGSMGAQCAGNPDLTLNFNVVASPTVIDGMYAYIFRATAFRSNPDGFSYYLNFYRINAQNPNVMVDKIDNRLPCSLAQYPKSCPNTGQSYSSVGQPGAGLYGQQAIIDTRCNNGDSQLRIYTYDLDTGIGNSNNYGQNDIRGQVIETDPVTGAVTDVIPNQPGGALSDTGFPFSLLPQSYVGNDAELDLNQLTQTDNPTTPGHGYSEPFGYPKGSHLMLKPNKIYTIKITNLDRRNALQLIVHSEQYHPSRNCMPIGFFDSCSLVAGVTHFYGWAYDTDATTSVEPQVSLSISGTSSVSSGNLPTDKDLRTAAIETYLGGVRPGMPLVRYYGFDWPVNGLSMGGSYTIAGVALNTGGGTSTALRYNATNFPGGTIPASCLPSTPPGTLSCPNTGTAGIASFSEQEYGLPGTLRVYVIGAGTVPTATSATITIAGLPNPVVTLLAPNPPPANTSSPIASAGVTFPNPGDYAVSYVVNWAGGTVSCNATVSVYGLPYLKAFGADIIAGSGFGAGSCSSASGGVYGFAQPTGGFRGASAQFGITSLLNVNGVYSASQRASAPVPAKGLTFSNSAGVGDATYGGASGGGSTCIPDYYTVTRDTSLASGAFNGSLAAGLGKRQYTLAGGSTISALNVPRGTQAAVYVNGNVFINGDITYDTAARSGVADIPYFALIVRNGNIYIAPGVSRLDGVYIAEPTDFNAPGSLGRIYTCAPGAGSLYDAAQLSTACDDQPLAINGALIAQQVKFLRTLNTLRESTIGEIPSFMDGSRGATYKAAETINYNPEIYLAPSPLRNPNSPPGADVFGTPDAIFSLPPVF